MEHPFQGTSSKQRYSLRYLTFTHAIHPPYKIGWASQRKILKLKFCKAYADVESQKPLALVGSHNFLEISINQGNAAEAFKIKSGDKVTLYRS